MSSNLDTVRDARLRDYGDGIIDGFEIALRLFLGEPANGAQPCPQPLTPEAEAWARDALARITEQRVTPW